MPEYPNITKKKAAKAEQTPEQMLMIFQSFATRQNAREKAKRING